MVHDVLGKIKAEIKLAFEEQCDGCKVVKKLIQTKQGYAAVEEKVIRQVMAGVSIIDAIVGVDDEYDINHLD